MNGTLRRRTPTESSIAFAIAAGAITGAISPAP